MIVFKNDNNGKTWWNASFSDKLESGEELRKSMIINFKKGYEPQMVDKYINIIVKDFFMKPYRNNKGEIELKMVVLEWYEGKPKNKAKEEYNNRYERANDEDDFPF